MVGRATLTMVESRNTIPDARTTANRTHLAWLPVTLDTAPMVPVDAAPAACLTRLRRARYDRRVSTQASATSSHAHAAELAVAVEAARAAAAIQVEHYERLEHIVKKSARDVVTEADHLSEAAIIATIRRAFPDDQVLAEESGHSGASTGSGPVDGSGSSAPVEAGHRIWVIDPLDGTVNYAAGIPHFCTSVGFIVGGQPTVGVVMDPMRDELFSAVRGQGASLDGRRIHAASGVLGDGVISLALPPAGFARRDRALHRLSGCPLHGQCGARPGVGRQRPVRRLRPVAGPVAVGHRGGRTHRRRRAGRS